MSLKTTWPCKSSINSLWGVTRREGSHGLSEEYASYTKHQSFHVSQLFGVQMFLSKESDVPFPSIPLLW